MKKKLLTVMLASALALTFGTMMAQAGCDKGPCPAGPGGKPCPPPHSQIKGPGHGKPMMSPEEQEAKKADFEKRMNFTDEQKAQTDKIKADEKKKLEPIQKKIEKKQEELKALRNQEFEIRKESMDKFQAILTPEQKAEMEKMKEEMRKNMGFKPHGDKGCPKECAKVCPPDKKCVEGCKCKDNKPGTKCTCDCPKKECKDKKDCAEKKECGAAPCKK